MHSHNYAPAIMRAALHYVKYVRRNHNKHIRIFYMQLHTRHMPSDYVTLAYINIFCHY